MRSENKRVNEVVDAVCDHCKDQIAHGPWRSAMISYFESIPEFTRPQWIKCSERMPEQQTDVYAACGLGEERFILPARYGSLNSHTFWVRTQWNSDAEIKNVTHWMPRFVPTPQVLESELVIGLRSLRGWFHGTLGNNTPVDSAEAIAIIDAAIELAKKDGAK